MRLTTTPDHPPAPDGFEYVCTVTVGPRVIAHHYRDPADDHALVKFFPGTPGVTPPRWITYRDEGGIFVPVEAERA